jgi:hypothetical protein
MTENKAFNFLLGWALMIVLLSLINRMRLGHVVIYYSLLLAIMLILVTEYKKLAPLLSGIESIGQFNAQG